MGEPANYFCQPGINANTGTGTAGDPFGDAQFGLNTITRNTSNGDQLTILGGTAEFLSAAPSFATYGTPTLTSPFRFVGGTAVAGDGGVGWLHGGAGSFQLWDGAKSHVYFKDIEFSHGANTTALVAGTTENYFDSCYFHDYTGAGGSVLRLGTGYGIRLRMDTLGSSTSIGIMMIGTDCNVDDCYIKGVAGMQGIRVNASGCRVERNIISDCGSWGILSSVASTIRNNSILATNSVASGRGIEQESTATGGLYITGNIVEGYTGASAIGIRVLRDAQLMGLNAVRNCTTAYSVTGDKHVDLGDDETLSATAFAKSGSDTFANRAVYFAPLDVGNVWGGARFGLDKGALQHSGGAGSIFSSPLIRGAA